MLILYICICFFTCNGITIINNFLSRSAKICFINVQPVPISTIVIKRTAPLSLLNKI